MACLPRTTYSQSEHPCLIKYPKLVLNSSLERARLRYASSCKKVLTLVPCISELL